MNKVVKGCLIGGLACLLIGTVVSTAALAMGAVPWQHSGWDYDFDIDSDSDSDFASLSWADTESFDDISSLKLDCSAGQVILQTGAVDVVTVKSEKSGRYSWKVDGQTLKIDSNHGRGMNDRRRLVIQVPEGFTWDEFTLDMKAGSFHADNLTADRAKLELKAGSVEIAAGTIGRLAAEISAGHILCQAIVQGNTDIECAAGDIFVWLQGSEEDYHWDVDCKLGTVQVGSYSLAALKGERNYNKNAERKLDIECSSGAVYVEFTD